MKKADSSSVDVYNSDVFQILLNYEVSRSRRYPCPLTMIQIEMEPTAFTPEALSAAPLIFAAALNAHLRSSDIPARAGKLFTLLLPNSDRHGAQSVCERLLSVFKNKFEDANGEPVTFSLHIGAATLPGGDTMNGAGLFEKSGEALEQSKRKGPNTCVVIA
jgi:hypothetical protein